MTADVTPNETTGDLDKPLYSVNVASEILSSDPDTLLVDEGLGPRHADADRVKPQALHVARDMLGLTALRRLTRHGQNIMGARYVIRYLQLLDAQHIPRPLELANIRVEHVCL